MYSCDASVAVILCWRCYVCLRVSDHIIR